MSIAIALAKLLAAETELKNLPPYDLYRKHDISLASLFINDFLKEMSPEILDAHCARLVDDCKMAVRNAEDDLNKAIDERILKTVNKILASRGDAK